MVEFEEEKGKAVFYAPLCFFGCCCFLLLGKLLYYIRVFGFVADDGEVALVVIFHWFVTFGSLLGLLHCVGKWSQENFFTFEYFERIGSYIQNDRSDLGRG